MGKGSSRGSFFRQWATNGIGCERHLYKNSIPYSFAFEGGAMFSGSMSLR